MAPEMTNKHDQNRVLCILDGWGDGPDSATNAITRAHTPNWDAMSADGFQARLDASEQSRRPARRPNGKFRSRTYESWRRTDCSARLAAH